MTILNPESTFLDGITVEHAITPFMPSEDTSSSTLLEMNGRTVGVTFGMEPFPYLRFMPDWQLPEGARSEDQWHRFEFSSKNEHVMDMYVDFIDGEVKYLKILDDEMARDQQAIIESVVEIGDWVTKLYPEFVKFVRQQLVKSE